MNQYDYLLEDANLNNPEIVYLPIESLFPHKDNPRKDLGNLEELADSIRQRGVMQNLTVVPQGYGIEDKYTIVIGHRRHAAAKLAGLTHLPCIISNMSYKEQISMMLLENMQRNNLTVYEEVQGIQMMIDLGETVESVSEQTGLSATTVRKRLKLTRLDKKTFERTQDREVTLMDYLAVAELKDAGRRDFVLGLIGTKEFAYELQKARQMEKNAELKEKFMALLQANAVKVDIEANHPTRLKTIGYFYPPFTEVDKLKKLLDAHSGAKAYKEYVSMIYLYVETTEEEISADTEKERKQREEDAARCDITRRLNEIYDNIRKIRDEWVRHYTPTKADTDIIVKFAFSIYGTSVQLAYLRMVGEDTNKMWSDYIEIAETTFLAEYHKNPLAALLKKAYFSMDLKVLHNCNNEQISYMAEYYAKAYDVLKSLGYQPSDEEQKYVDGTHELYSKKK